MHIHMCVCLLSQPSAKAQAKNRQSVSAEAYGEWNKKTDFKAPVSIIYIIWLD